MYKENGIWRISPNGTSTSHKTLEWACKERSHWVIEYLIPAVRDGDCHTAREKHAAIDAELERDKGPKTFAGWCPRCEHTTRHTLDTGCVQCVAYKEARK